MRNIWLKLIVWIIFTTIIGYFVGSLGSFLGWMTGMVLGCNDDPVFICIKGMLFGFLAGGVLTVALSIKVWNTTNFNA